MLFWVYITDYSFSDDKKYPSSFIKIYWRRHVLENDLHIGNFDRNRVLGLLNRKYPKLLTTFSMLKRVVDKKSHKDLINLITFVV